MPSPREAQRASRLLLALIFTFTLSLASCGFSSGGGNSTPPTPPGTPPPSPGGPPPVTDNVTVLVTPPGSQIPVQGYQSLTAIVEGAVDTTVQWKITSGSAALVGSGNTVGLRSSSPGQVTVTATSLADNSKNASATVTFVASPVPRTDHPRMWVTSDQLPKLRSWASGSNPIWQKGMVFTSAAYKATADAHWCWSNGQGKCGSVPPGQPDTGWSSIDCGNNCASTEVYASMFALMSMVDPAGQTARDNWGVRAHDLIMWEMNQMALGFADVPYRNAGYVDGDRAHLFGSTWARVVDWLQAGNYLSTTDKQTILKVFKMWGQFLATGKTSYGYVMNQEPLPLFTYNDPSLLGSQRKVRISANTYWNAATSVLTSIVLALDAADDPPVNPGDPADTIYPDGTANTLRAYLKLLTGAYLYTEWANFEDAHIVASAYGLAYPFSCKVDTQNHGTMPQCLGQNAGGIHTEGTQYLDTIPDLANSLWMLHTAGYDDPAAYGPQMSLWTSSWWALMSRYYLHSIVPEATSYGSNANGAETRYLNFAFGDLRQEYYRYPTQGAFLAMIAGDLQTGLFDERLNTSYWILSSAADDNLFDRLQLATKSFDYPVFYFITYDPSKNPIDAPDPRSSMPEKQVYSDSVGRLIARTDWTSDATIFSYLCGAGLIDHELNDCGSFWFYRKGEWLEKTENMYDSTIQIPSNLMTAAYQNTETSNLWWNPPGGDVLEHEQYDSGAPFFHLVQNGVAKNRRVSYGPAYAYAFADTTDTYNCRASVPATNSVTHASRDVLWIKPDWIVVYDRGETNTGGLDKAVYFGFTGSALVNGHTITETTSSGQKLYVEALLPSSASITLSPITPFADADPISGNVEIDAGSVQSVRFLNVLQGADGGASQIETQLLQSSSGTKFDGAVIGTLAVLFVNDATQTFSSVTYSVPSSVTAHYVTGLIPGGAYSVTTSAKGNNNEVTVTPGGTSAADSAGVLTF